MGSTPAGSFELMAPVILQLAVERDRFDDILYAGIYLLAKKLSGTEFEEVSEDLFKQERNDTRISLISSIKHSIIKNDPWETFAKIVDSTSFRSHSKIICLEGLFLVESEILQSSWSIGNDINTLEIRKYLREKVEEWSAPHLDRTAQFAS